MKFDRFWLLLEFVNYTIFECNMALQMGQSNALFQSDFSCWHRIIRAPYCFTIYLAVCSQCCKRDEPCRRPSSTINHPHQWPPAHSNKLSLADKHSTTPEFTADSGWEEGWWDRNMGMKEEALHPGCVNDAGDSNNSGWQTLLGWRCKRGSRFSRHEYFLTGYRETFTVHLICWSSSRTMNHPDTHKH